MNLNRVSRSFLLLTLAIFSLLLLPSLFQQGMFMDGMIYSTISHNMANGYGSFYYPYFSKTIMPVFQEHPPLVLGIESLFFKILGDHFYVEKLYSFFTALLSALMITLFWKKFSLDNKRKQLFWLPLLFWIIVPTISWTYANNMLENTMGLFSLISSYFLVLTFEKQKRKKYLYLIIAAIFLFMAFLAKGFPGLYPLALPAIYFIVYPERLKMKEMLISSLLLLISTILIFSLYIYSSGDAYENFRAYFNNQVISSMEGHRETGSRLALFTFLFRELIIPFIIVLLLFITYYAKSFSSIFKEGQKNKEFLFFFLIALSATLPLMLSPKQLSHYIVPSIPYFALAFSMLIVSIVRSFLQKIDVSSFWFRFFTYFSISLILVALCLSIYNYGSYSRDKDLIQDIDKIATNVGASSTLTLINNQNLNWPLITQFQRKYYINMDISGDLLEYLVLQKDDKMVEGYDVVNIDLSQLRLLKKK